MAENRQQVGDALAALGLSRADAELYAALVRHPRSPASQIAQHCGVSASQAGRALSRLVSGGLANRLPGRRPRYVAAVPDVVLGAMINRRESELGAARAAVHELMELHRETSRFAHLTASVEVVIGSENISRQVDHMHASVQRQLHGFDRPPYVDTPGHKSAIEHRRLREGIKYRVIYDQQALSWPGRMEQDILPSVAQGEQARVRPELPTKLLIADDQIAIIPISSSEHVMDFAYLIHPSTLLDALARLFDAEWERAVPLSAATGRPAAGRAVPEQDTTALLSLLAAGQTDARIARSLGWSLRTTQRRVHQLMTALNATTRFQAGIAARDRGWI
ncbi:MAG TPA: helix-turn-helix domain-containing protein [Streptosporangiaceae bacterium]|nr:helix-turn-helix domain-containing protein [Streptosporangiaceae bacterium]